MITANTTSKAHNSPEGAELRLENVSFTYGETEMLFNLHLPKGCIATIIGPSGSGKSTLLNLIAGFEQPLSGTILINNNDVTADPIARRPVSMVFQDNNLFAHLDVQSNIGLGRSPSLKLQPHDRIAIAEAIDRVGLTGKELRKPEALSGGERQRVALARALVRQKPLLLLDEAFASLGPALRLQMLDLVRELQKETAMSVLMVTHTPEDALYLDSILFFLKDGHIQAHGAAQDLLSAKGPPEIRDYIGV